MICKHKQLLSQCNECLRAAVNGALVTETRVRGVLAWMEQAEREAREDGPRDFGRITRYGSDGEARAFAACARRLREALGEGEG